MPAADTPYLYLWMLILPLALLARRRRASALEVHLGDTYLVIDRWWLAAGVAARLLVDGLAYYTTRDMPLGRELILVHLAGTVVFCLGCAAVDSRFLEQLGERRGRWRMVLFVAVLLAGLLAQVALLLNLLRAAGRA